MSVLATPSGADLEQQTTYLIQPPSVQLLYTVQPPTNEYQPRQRWSLLKATSPGNSRHSVLIYQLEIGEGTLHLKGAPNQDDWGYLFMPSFTLRI